MIHIYQCIKVFFTSSLRKIQTVLTFICRYEESKLAIFPSSLTPILSDSKHIYVRSQYIVFIFFLFGHCILHIFFFFPPQLLVWSHCKYFQYSVTVPWSPPSLPGVKQNSHLRFSCGAFLANIIAARPSTLCWPQNNSPFSFPGLP